MAAKKKSIDGAKLIKMVEDKVPRPEIMKKLNIKTSNQLTLAYARAQMEAGKIPDIAGGRGGAAPGSANEITVGKRGSVIIPKDWQRVLESLSVTNFPLGRPRRG